MDGDRFDALARSLAAHRPRRAALRALAGAALAGPLALVGAREAAARCLRNGEACRRGPQCCSGVCRRGENGKKCRAAPSQLTCTVERDVCAQGSAARCGPPGNECYCWVTARGASFCGGNDGAYGAASCDECAGAGRVCVRGGGAFCDGPVACVLPCCPRGYRECGGRCVDVLRDPDNCGACGRTCGPDRPNVCAGGSCCINAGGEAPCSCSPSGGACAPVGAACCSGGACARGVCP